MRKIIFVNTSVRWLGEFINKLLLFLFFVIIARYLGKEDFGYFSYSIAFGSIVGAFTDLGTNLYLLKYIIKEKIIEKILKNIISIKIFISLIIFLFTIIYGIVVTKKDYILVLITLFLLLSAFLDPAIYVFRSQKNMFYETLLVIMWRLLTMGIGGFCIVFFNFSLLKTSIILNIFALLSVFIASVIMKKIYNVKYFYVLKPNLPMWLNILKNSIPIGIILILGSIFFKFNIIILRYFKDSSELGLYSASFKLIESCFFISSFFIASIFPFMYENRDNSKIFVNQMKIFKKSAFVLFFVAFIIATIVNIFSKFILELIYGSNFINADIPFKILSIALIFIFLNELFLYFYMSIEKEKLFLKIMSIIVSIYIILCFLVIPRWGASGAAFAILVSQVLFLIFNLLIYKKINV